MAFFDSPQVNTYLNRLIILNAAILGAFTYESVNQFALLVLILIYVDKVIIIIFTGELIAKLFFFRKQFFTASGTAKYWNRFDCFIILTYWVVWGIVYFDWFDISPAVVAACRALRLARLVSINKKMAAVLNQIGRALRRAQVPVLLLGLLMFIFALIGNAFFGDRPEFQNLHISMFTLMAFSVGDFYELSMDLLGHGYVVAPWYAGVYFWPALFIMAFLITAMMEGKERQEYEEQIAELQQGRDADEITMAILRQQLRENGKEPLA